jgi:hypothetical protein
MAAYEQAKPERHFGSRKRPIFRPVDLNSWGFGGKSALPGGQGGLYNTAVNKPPTRPGANAGSLFRRRQWTNS